MAKTNEDYLALLDMTPDDVFLAHYGVKGMKWGVRRTPEQLGHRVASMGPKGKQLLRTSLGKARANAKNKASRLGVAIKARYTKTSSNLSNRLKLEAAAHKQKKLDKKAMKAEQKALRKELGMSKHDYDKLRNRTLKSHDPAVVAKGMHTLSDKELNAKIDRLGREEAINRLATNKATNEAAARKAKYEAFTRSPGYILLAPVAKDALDQVVSKTLVSQGLQPVAEQRTKYYAEKAQFKFASQHPDLKSPWKGEVVKTTSATRGMKSSGAQAKASSSSSSSASSTPKRQTSTKPRNQTAKMTSAMRDRIRSQSSSNRASSGKSWVDNQVIDVTPLEYSSKRKTKAKDPWAMA